jgi:alpha-tubulin suppressor-like RCC1 family protein
MRIEKTIITLVLAGMAMLFSGCSVVDRSVHYHDDNTTSEANTTAPTCPTAETNATCPISPETNASCPSCPETNTSCPEKEDKVTVAVANLRMELDVNETVKIINWKDITTAVSSGNGVIPTQIKTQGQHGTFALDGDRLIYVAQADGNMTDSGVVTLGEGSGAVEVAVEVVHHYWKEMTTGMYYTLAIKDDGTLWAWGANSYGQLGDGTRNDRAKPVQVGASDTWQHVAASLYYSMGIQQDGTLWGWGRNNLGQLGLGSRSDKYIPTQEPSKSTDWLEIATGYEFSVALKKDGTLWSTGRNNYGQLADGTTTDHYVFTDVTPAGTVWKGIAAGMYHMLALKDDSTLWGCGRNNYGQVGEGTASATLLVLTQEASGDSDWQALAAGENHSLALKSDGRLFGWGYNGNYQAGDGTRTSHNTPTQEATAANDWVQIAAGSYHSVGIKNDGTLWGWGTNNYGQLGERLNVTRMAPEVIDDEHYWQHISASRYQTDAVSQKAVALIWGATIGPEEN